MDAHQPSRHSIRLQDYDYSQSGAYFITFCTHARVCLLGEMRDATVMLSNFGTIAYSCWLEIPEHFPQVQIDEFVVMPNHLHGVIVIEHQPGDGDPEATSGATCRAPTAQREHPALGTIVQSFKAAVTRQVNVQTGAHGAKLWQRGYYEHVIRSEAALARIRQYVAENPAKWADDHDNPANWRP